MGTLLAMIISLSVMSGCGHTASTTQTVLTTVPTRAEASAPPPVTVEEQGAADELGPIQPTSAPRPPTSAPTTNKERTHQSTGPEQAPKKKQIWIPEPLVQQPYLGGYLNLSTVRR
jgi:hypothetical protein